MRRFFFTGVRTRLAFLFLLALLPIIVLEIIRILDHRRDPVESAKKRAEELINFAVMNEEDILRETRQILGTLSEIPTVVRGEERCNELLAVFRRNYPQYANFGVIRPDGEVYGSAIPLKNPVNDSDRAFFRDALATREFSIGHFEVGRISGKPSIYFGYPVMDRKGKVTAVVFASLDLSEVKEFEYKTDALTTRNYTYVKLDRNGSVLTSYPTLDSLGKGNFPGKPIFERISKEKKGTFHAVGADGVERLYTFSILGHSLHKGSAYVLLAIPTKEILAKSEQELTRSVAILAVVTLLALAVIWLGGRKLIVRPVGVLVETSKRLAAGDLSARAGLPPSMGELGQLSEAFDEMAVELHRGQDESRKLLDVSVEKQELGNRLLSLMNNIPGVVYRGLRDWSVAFIGADVERMTGNTPEEFLSGKAKWRDLIHTDDLEHVKNAFREAVRAGMKVLQVEYRAVHRDGTVRRISDRRQLFYNGDGSFAYVDGLLLDITGQKQAEEQILWNYHTQKALTSILQVSVEHFSLAEKMERTLDFIFKVPWIKAESKGCVFLVEDDPEMLVMTAHRGVSPELLSTCGTIAFGKCLCGKAASSRKMIFSGGGDERHEFHRDKAGSHGHYCVPILSNDMVIGILNLYIRAGHKETERETGFLTAVCNTLTGTIERDRAEKGLKRLATAVEQAGEIIMITDLKGEIQYVNPAFERITGYRCVEAIGKNPRILKSGEQDEAFYKELWATLLRDEIWFGTLTNRRKDGTLYEQDTVISPVRDGSGKVVNYVGVLRDNTRERRLEEQLRQSQKMEAIGTLAGGVAHDFNNLLTVIEGYSDLLLSRLGEGNPLASEVREIRKASDSASSLTRQLLAFSRMQVFQPKVLDLNGLVANVRKMLGRLIGENIELVTLPGENLGRVKADPGQIEQVLLNLVVNARDAVPDGGRITIETSNVTLDESFASKQVAFRPGPYVMLTVADTGTGMDKETMSRIFEPFFTTKDTGKGTGLGLATVYGIVKQSNGYVWTYSEPGHGTTFKVHLPRVDEQPEEEAPRPQIPARSSGSETVLVVEDIEMVRNLVHEVLVNYGYTVLEASDGNEALALCARLKEPIHLLVTDMMMPKMSGTELAKAVSSIRPGIRVLYMSGYTEYGSTENSGLPGGSFFIQKPFSIAGLTRKVREVLES
jgi:PAS domain S-box-containing protein